MLSERCAKSKSNRDGIFGKHLVKLQRFLTSDPTVQRIDAQSELGSNRLSQTHFYLQAVDYISRAGEVLGNMAADSDDDESRVDCNVFFESAVRLKRSLLSSAGAIAVEARNVRTRYMPDVFRPEDVSVERRICPVCSGMMACM
jgi:hypothetical protein